MNNYNRYAGRALTAGCSALAIMAGVAATPAQAEDFTVVLDTVTVVTTKTEERAIDSLASVSIVGNEEIERIQATDVTDLLRGLPGVSTAGTQDNTGIGTSINIRGLQDFGRVAMIVDGARNNFARNDHGSASSVWIDPELLKQVTVVRGPVSNIYGSGAIGGVVVFETKAAHDFLYPGETFAASWKNRYETNGDGFVSSATAAGILSESVDLIGNVTFRTRDDYTGGDGNEVPNSEFDMASGMLKSTIRANEYHETTLGWIGNNGEWEEPSASIPQGTDLTENIFTARHTYHDPADPWVDFHISGYVNDTEMAQTALASGVRFDPDTGLPVVVPVGARRDFNIQTVGFDVNNTSRFDTGTLFHELTIGGDWFRDDVETIDDFGATTYNPGGERHAYGAFIQDSITYSHWLEIIGALRYDGYELTSLDGMLNVKKDRVSPRLTVGVKPFEDAGLHGLQIYGTYAEGYRAPSVIETLMDGLHPAGVSFPFLPNPDLIPETAHTYEVGINYKRDDLFRPGDRLRLKAAYFHNRIDDYIGLVDDLSPFPGPGFDPNCTFAPGPGSIPVCAQFQNFDEVTIRGVELEAHYDTGRMFIGLSATFLDSTDESTGDPLTSVPPDQIVGTLGFRMMENALVIGGEV